MTNFLLMSLSGMGQIAVKEVAAKLPNSSVAIYKTRNFDLLQLATTAQATELFGLGMAEDIFVNLAKFSLGGQHGDLLALAASLEQPAIFEALNLHRQTAHFRHKKPAKRPTYRVVAQAEDFPWRTYRRVDLQKAAEKKLAQLFPRWKLVEDDADVEFWVVQSNRKLFVNVRLSDISLRQRTYKTANIPASLRPTIANALVFLSQPQDDDIFLDPMCGAGTILLERAHAGRYQKLLGGDVDPERLEAARQNFGAKHKPWELSVWDARKLPLADGTVSAIVTNPPWGKQLTADADHLYTQLLPEFARVLQPSGRAVILTSETRALQKALSQTPFEIKETYKNIQVLGQAATIFVLNKK